MLASRRLQVPPTFGGPRLDGVSGLVAVRGRAEHRRSALYDTVELDLTRWGARIEHDAQLGWRVELPPVGQLDRVTHLVAGGPTVPGSVHRYVRSLTGDQPLRRLVRLDVRADITLLVAEHDEEPVVVVADEEVSVTEGRRLVARFRELVLRPGTGATEQRLDAVEEVLRGAGAIPLRGGTSRLIGLLGPRAGAAPAVPDPRVAHDETVSLLDLAADALRVPVRELLLVEPHVRVGRNPEAVALLCESLARLRYGVMAWTSVGSASGCERLLTDVERLLADARSVHALDVLRSRITGAGARLDLPAGRREELDRRIESDRARAREQLISQLDDPATSALMVELTALAARPSFDLEDRDGDPAATLRDAARPAWLRLLDGASNDGHHTPSSDARDLLGVLAVIADASTIVEGKPARRFAKRLRRYQNALDQAAANEATVHWLQALATAPSATPSLAFTAGLLAGAEQLAAMEARGRVAGSWDRLQSGKARRWLAEPVT